MLKEDKKLKLCLVLHSFSPLFLLIFIRHVGHVDLIVRFFRDIFSGDWSVFEKAMHNNAFGDTLLSILCIIWLLITIMISFGLDVLNPNTSHGETITIGEEKKDSGITFLVTFIIPLLMDEVSTLRGFIFFVVMLFMVILLIMRSNLFYQNPVLAAILKYKIYEFKFNDNSSDVKANKTYIGITRGELPIDGMAIKRKYIADDVFLICKE